MSHSRFYIPVDITQDVGVSDDTAKRWLHVLEKSDITFYLRPYSNNLLKCTVKTPKLYFFDTGLVAYLTKYSSPDILASDAINRASLENYVIAELLTATACSIPAKTASAMGNHSHKISRLCFSSLHIYKFVIGI